MPTSLFDGKTFSPAHDAKRLGSQLEDWRSIPDWEGLYEVSDLGRVRSLPRVLDHPTAGMFTKAGRIMKPHANCVSGYEQIGLTARDGCTKHYYIHCLVAAAFIGECPAGAEVDHANNVRADNRAVNLRYRTRSANNQNTPARGACGFKGVTVCRRQRRTRYKAMISINNWPKFLGRFDTPEEAARAYDRAALALWGPSARLNFPSNEPTNFPHPQCASANGAA